MTYIVLKWNEGELEIYLSSSKELAEKMFTKDKSAVIITELEGMEKAIGEAKRRFGLYDDRAYR